MWSAASSGADGSTLVCCGSFYTKVWVTLKQKPKFILGINCLSCSSLNFCLRNHHKNSLTTRVYTVTCFIVFYYGRLNFFGSCRHLTLASFSYLTDINHHWHELVNSSAYCVSYCFVNSRWHFSFKPIQAAPRLTRLVGWQDMPSSCPEIRNPVLFVPKTRLSTSFNSS